MYRKLWCSSCCNRFFCQMRKNFKENIIEWHLFSCWDPMIIWILKSNTSHSELGFDVDLTCWITFFSSYLKLQLPPRWDWGWEKLVPNCNTTHKLPYHGIFHERVYNKYLPKRDDNTWICCGFDTGTAGDSQRSVATRAEDVGTRSALIDIWIITTLTRIPHKFLFQLGRFSIDCYRFN